MAVNKILAIIQLLPTMPGASGSKMCQSTVEKD